MRRLGFASALALLVPCGLLALAPDARGQEARSDESVQRANVDTTYGRIDGDLGISVGAGASFGPSAPRAAVDLRFRYLDTAGVFLSYEDGLSATASNPRRIVAAGFELRPLFLGRWLSGRELSIARADLLIDSLGFEVGAVLQQADLQGFQASPGFQASLGLELPILPSASGPWVGLHGGVRWSDAALEGARITDDVDRALFLELTVAYHQILGAHLVDVRDVAPR